MVPYRSVFSTSSLQFGFKQGSFVIGYWTSMIPVSWKVGSITRNNYLSLAITRAHLNWYSEQNHQQSYKISAAQGIRQGEVLSRFVISVIYRSSLRNWVLAANRYAGAVCYADDFP